MCFSASASFIASAGLTVLGIASVKKVKEPHHYGLAGIPFMFAAQQLTEGFVWLSMTRPELSYLHDEFSVLFLLFAQVVWPTWLPLAFFLFEKEPVRKKILKLFLFPGLIVSCYFLFCLYMYSIETIIVRHHIFYNLDFPHRLIPVAAGFYLVATVLPPLVSRNWYIRSMGILILVAYIVARLYFQPSLISVWCFFGIGIAVLVYMVIQKERGNVRAYDSKSIG